ncbi:HD domain-containing phosphohydrolase [Candidatus Omnitrophota bacterium]
MKKIQLTLSAKIVFILILFIVIPMVISVWITASGFNKLVEKQVDSRMYEGAKVVIKELHEYESRARLAAEALREDETIVESFINNSWQENEIYNKVEGYLNIAKVDFIRMYDETGKLLIGTDNGSTQSSLDFHKRISNYGLEGRVNAGIEFNGVELEIISSIPVINQGYIHGVIVTGYKVNEFLIDDLRNISSFDVAVYIDFVSKVTTFKDENETFVHVPISQKTIESLKEYIPYTDTTSYRNRYYQIKYYPLLGVEGDLVAALGVIMSTDGFLSANKKTFIYLVSIAGLLILLASLMGTFLTKLVMKPLEDLVLAGRKIRSGELSGFNGKMNHDEVGELAQSFNYMVDDLKGAFQDLEKANKNIKKAHLDTILRLAIAAEFKDISMAHHIRRMSEYSALIANEYGLPKEEVSLIKYASPMHDIGKIGVPDDILLKDRKLTHDEYEKMKRHTVFGSRIFKEAETPLLQAAEIISLTHHERYDGSGYPRGLKEKEIHIFGRIVAVADVFDALTSERVYKPAYPIEEALEHIRNESGRHFDPKVVEAFFSTLDKILEIKYSFGKDFISP